MGDTFEHKGRHYTFRPLDIGRFGPIDDAVPPATEDTAEAAERELRARYPHYDDIPQ